MLVARFVGPEVAENLRAGYRQHRVRFLDTRGVVPREPRYDVPAQARQRQKRKEQEATPPSAREIAAAARTLRKVITQGSFGSSGSTSRTRALTVARTLERGD